MIGDKYKYYKNYEPIIKQVISEVDFFNKQRQAIAVGGESGCGKTSLAFTFKIFMKKKYDLKGFIFHLDDYFKLPPLDNHNARLKNIKQVGQGEVNLKKLDKDLKQFKLGCDKLTKPLMNYKANKRTTETLNTSQYDFCLVEGTYVNLLSQADYKIFMESTYIDTKINRIERGRDEISEFIEQVLEIEHQILKEHSKLANLVINYKNEIKTINHD